MGRDDRGKSEADSARTGLDECCGDTVMTRYLLAILPVPLHAGQVFIGTVILGQAWYSDSLWSHSWLPFGIFPLPSQAKHQLGGFESRRRFSNTAYTGSLKRTSPFASFFMGES